MNTEHHEMTHHSYINYMPFSNKLVKVMKFLKSQKFLSLQRYHFKKTKSNSKSDKYKPMKTSLQHFGNEDGYNVPSKPINIIPMHEKHINNFW
jgi:hypothetical protein